MNREKQVEEIYEQIKYTTGSYDSDARDCAAILYDYMGYRKASEVINAFSEELIKRFNDLEYYANTPRKTIKVDELRAQVDWILHEVTVNTIKEFAEKYVEAMNG